MTLQKRTLTIEPITGTIANNPVEINTVLVKVASRCNINCSYCYIYNMGDEGWKKMPPLVSPEIMQALAHALAKLAIDQKTAFATVLHGGEPLMLGARKLAELLTLLRDALPESYPIAMQTNGMLITDEILDICASQRTSISISIDGPKPINDRFRIGHKKESTYEKVVEGIDRLRGHASSEFLFAGLLCVIDPLSDPAEIYQFLKDLGAPSMDFLYRDGNHSNLPFGKTSTQSTEYGDWLSGLLSVYLADKNPPRIRILDDLIRIQLGGRGIKEGVGVTDYGIAIIETDGSVTKNDTLKSSFNGADRFGSEWTVQNTRLTDIFDSDEFRQYHELQRPSSAICKSCEYLYVCGGGMPLHRWKAESGYDNPSVYCSDQKKIIEAVKERLKVEGLRT